MEEALRPSDGVVYEVVDGEAVVLQLGTGTYFQLNRVATIAWESIVRNGCLDDAKVHIVASFDVDDASVDRDLAALVDDLRGRGLVVPAPRSRALP